jgi:hypothetical protein
MPSIPTSSVASRIPLPPLPENIWGAPTLGTPHARTLKLARSPRSPTLTAETCRIPAPPASNDATRSETPTTPAPPIAPVPTPAPKYSSPWQTATPSQLPPQTSAAPTPDSANAALRTAPPPPSPQAPASQTPPSTGSSKTNSAQPAATNKTPGTLQTSSARPDVSALDAASPKTIPQNRSAGNSPQKTTPPVSWHSTNYPLAIPSSLACPAALQNSPPATPVTPTMSTALLPAISRCTTPQIP